MVTTSTRCRRRRPGRVTADPTATILERAARCAPIPALRRRDRHELLRTPLRCSPPPSSYSYSVRLARAVRPGAAVSFLEPTGPTGPTGPARLGHLLRPIHLWGTGGDRTTAAIPTPPNPSIPIRSDPNAHAEGAEESSGSSSGSSAARAHRESDAAMGRARNFHSRFASASKAQPTAEAETGAEAAAAAALAAPPRFSFLSARSVVA